MTDAFEALIAKHRARMAALLAIVERDGCLHAISARDESYSIFLSRNGSSDAAWRVTSFRALEPIGHREYDVLIGKEATQDALGEFAGEGWQLVPRPGRRTLTAHPQP